MGMNYYAGIPCAHCGHVAEERHIGKSSAGWCFSLHVYPDEGGPRDLSEWEAAWCREGVVIRNESGDVVTPAQMRSIIVAREANPFPFREIWYRQNHAVSGPNNLARHVVDGSHCVGHGPGTYDYIIGDFS